MSLKDDRGSGVMVIITRSLEETLALGEKIGRRLLPGEVVALEGELGAGKTTLIQGICAGLGVRDEVTSPTFVLLQEYEGDLPVFHFDAYRLEDGKELADIGCEEYFERGGICLIEWADRVREILPGGTLRIRLEYVPGRPGERLVSLQGLEDRMKNENSCV